jgi:competence protein ComEC
LRVVAGDGVAVLLPGDLDRGSQQRLLEDGLPASAVVVLPGHASAAGYLRAFRDASAPQYAVVSHSMSGASAASVQGTMAAWRDAGAEVLLTAESGAIEFTAGAGNLAMTTQR